MGFMMERISEKNEVSARTSSDRDIQSSILKHGEQVRQKRDYNLLYGYPVCFTSFIKDCVNTITCRVSIWLFLLFFSAGFLGLYNTCRIALFFFSPSTIVYTFSKYGFRLYLSYYFQIPWSLFK